jgi:hypothetical protein
LGYGFLASERAWFDRYSELYGKEVAELEKGPSRFCRVFQGSSPGFDTCRKSIVYGSEDWLKAPQKGYLNASVEVPGVGSL